MRKRDYKAEYAKRIAKGLSRGVSKSAARGHAKASEAKPPGVRGLVKPTDPLHKALSLMKSGVGLTTAARTMRVSPERLRRALATHTNATREGRRWKIEDKRHFQLPLYSNGRALKVVVDNDAARDIGRYMAAVGEFFTSNDVAHLGPFEGRGVRDSRRRFHTFETDPNNLYELDSAGELSFPEVYRIVV